MAESEERRVLAKRKTEQAAVTSTQAYFALNRTAATGVDGQTWEGYGANLQDLHERIHSGSYKPRPTKRVWLPKPDGRKRPIGITALEDKIVQQALVWVLESIYEEDFLGFSYGFRLGRSQHQALDAVYMALTTKKVGWVLDADIQGFFDHLDHEWLMQFVSHRVSDRRVLDILVRTLRAGVEDEGRRERTRAGTPQGAVISPLLANIYLHARTAFTRALLAAQTAPWLRPALCP